MIRTNTNSTLSLTATTTIATKRHAVSSSVLNRRDRECRAEGFAGFPPSARMPWSIDQNPTSST